MCCGRRGETTSFSFTLSFETIIVTAEMTRLEFEVLSLKLEKCYEETTSNSKTENIKCENYSKLIHFSKFVIND